MDEAPVRWDELGWDWIWWEAPGGSVVGVENLAVQVTLFMAGGSGGIRSPAGWGGVGWWYFYWYWRVAWSEYIWEQTHLWVEAKPVDFIHTSTLQHNQSRGINSLWAGTNSWCKEIIPRKLPPRAFTQLMIHTMWQNSIFTYKIYDLCAFLYYLNTGAQLLSSGLLDSIPHALWTVWPTQQCNDWTVH